MRISDWSSDVCSSDLYGQNPPGLKWKQMETPHFQVIFPEVLLGEARRTAEILEYFRPYESSPLRDFPEKTPILLQNQTVISNGFVTLAPRRAEFYMTPPQNNGPGRSEEHTSELQSLMRNSYAVFCLKQKNKRPQQHTVSNIFLSHTTH